MGDKKRQVGMEYPCEHKMVKGYKEYVHQLVSVANTYFQHQDAHKDVWYIKREEWVHKSMTDMFLVRKNMIVDVIYLDFR